MSDPETWAGPPPEDTGGTAAPGDADAGPGEPGGTGGAPHAWRLTFAYDGDDVRVVGRQRVRMQAPPDESPLVEQAEDGYWLQVRDAADAPLHTQVLHRPIATDYEVFSPDRMARVPAPETRGVFQAVVPDLADGDAVVLHGPGGDAAARRRAAETGPGAVTDGPSVAEDAGTDVAEEPPPLGGTDASSAADGRGRTLLRAPMREGDDGGDG